MRYGKADPDVTYIKYIPLGYIEQEQKRALNRGPSKSGHYFHVAPTLVCAIYLQHLRKISSLFANKRSYSFSVIGKNICCCSDNRTAIERV